MSACLTLFVCVFVSLTLSVQLSVSFSLYFTLSVCSLVSLTLSLSLSLSLTFHKIDQYSIYELIFVITLVMFKIRLIIYLQNTKMQTDASLLLSITRMKMSVSKPDENLYNLLLLQCLPDSAYIIFILDNRFTCLKYD